MKSGTEYLHFEAAMPRSDSGDSATQGSKNQARKALGVYKPSPGRGAAPVHLNQ